MSDMKERLIDLVATQLGVEPSEVVGDARILDDLGADSLDVVELAMSIEETFDITIPDEAIEGLVTVGQIQSYVERHSAS